MDFERDNSMETENGQTENLKENVYSSDASQNVAEETQEAFASAAQSDETEGYTAEDYTSGESVSGQVHQDGYSFEQTNVSSGEYRIPHPKQDRDFGGSEADGNSYNPYRAARNDNSGYNGGYNGNYNGGNSGSGYSDYQPKKQPSSGTGKKVIAVLLALFIIFGSMGLGISIGRRSGGSSETPTTEGTTGDTAQITIGTTETTGTGISVSPGTIVAEKARDSVVGVVTYDSRGELYGEGSGVVMGKNEEGTLTYIITCAHVISESGIASYGILLEDGTVYDAKVVGYDERTDLGVLSIKETNLKAANFGDSSALRVGETVYAIGNPGGASFYGSVTDGIVSALDRSITSTYTMQVIQHTAAISPGNSGGALVNSAGQVIGINSSKIAATDYEGIGFAVPMKTAKDIVENIIAYGYVPNRPKLGISYASVSEYQAYSMVVQIKGLPAGSVIIAGITDDSSLKDSKAEVGDMITAVNGKDMHSSDVLLDAIDNAKIGDKLQLEICRIDSRTYKVSTFTVTATIVEDKGSSVKADEEETTTESYYDYYGNNDQFGGYSNFEDFFNQFFGN